MLNVMESSNSTVFERRTGRGSFGDDYALVARAIEFIGAARAEQPSLARLAAHLGLGETQTQRLFTRWAGISPKRFLQHLNAEEAKRCMAATGDLMELAWDTGLSGSGRLHDLFVTLEAMSPGEFRLAAAGMTLSYARGDTPFGSALVVWSPRGICHLSFVDDGDGATAPAELQRQWPESRWRHDPSEGQALLSRVFSGDLGRAARGLSLWISGSNFQIQVWRALLQIPAGGLLSYGQLAELMGRPRAGRSVGTAIAANPVAYLIPCHRVLRQTGDAGQYHWGTTRKLAMVGWEASQDVT